MGKSSGACLVCLCFVTTPSALWSSAADAAADSAVPSAGQNAQTGPESADQPAAAKLPPWLDLGIEYNARIELHGNLDFNNDHAGPYFLNRMRFTAAVAARRWLRFSVQLQDSRAPGFSDADSLDSVSHHLDFRQAFIELGSGQDAGWRLRLGRQELPLGDERLVGADPFWDNLGQTFDAARLSRGLHHLTFDAFAAWKVNPNYDQIERPATGNQLYGLSVSWEHRQFTAAPYFFWNRNRELPDAWGTPCGGSVYTPGFRVTGVIPKNLEYNVELALQRGYRPEGPVRAWAGHWALDYPLPFLSRTSRLSAEYNFASGSSNPLAGPHRTFDDLYPAGYNRYGMLDPFPWRNIQGLALGADWSIGPRWKVAAGYRAFWLADRHDALYSNGDDSYRRNPTASSAFVGSQLSVLVTWNNSKRSQLNLGYAYFFPGPFLRESSLQGRMSTPFVMWNYRL